MNNKEDPKNLESVGIDYGTTASQAILVYFQEHCEPGVIKYLTVPEWLLKLDPNFSYSCWLVVDEWFDCTAVKRVSSYSYKRVIEWCKAHDIYSMDLNPQQASVLFSFKF